MAKTAKKRRRPRYSVGDPCYRCGRPFRLAGVTRAYVECETGHVALRRTICTTGSCRRIARQFGCRVRHPGFWAKCDDHAP
jgi:hypothetical protein